jgi:hypothetical protein
MWAGVAPRLRNSLRARGVDLATAEDISQLVATRGYIRARTIPFPSEPDLLRWGLAVARNLVIQDARRRSRLATEPVPDRPSADDVERRVQHRLALEEVAHHLSNASPSDRQALSAGLRGTPPASRREGLALGLRRHRLRKRLLGFVEGLLAGAARWRDWLFEAGTAPAAGVAAVVASASIMAALSALGGGSGRPAELRPHSALPGLTAAVTAERPLPGRPRQPPTRALPPRVSSGAAERRVVTVVPIGVADHPAATAKVYRGAPADPLICMNHFPIAGTHCVPWPLPVPRL